MQKTMEEQEHTSFIQRSMKAILRGFRKVSRMWLSHFILLGILGLYTVAGGFLFLSIEQSADYDKRYRVMRNTMWRNMWEQARNETADEVMWTFDLRTNFEAMQTTICEQSFLDYAVKDEVASQWTLTRAIYFSFLVYTTIGYGDIVPVSDSGRALTVVYALIGIPFFLVVVRDLGNGCHQGLKIILFSLKKHYYGGGNAVKGNPPTRKSLINAPCRKFNVLVRLVELLTISWGSRPYKAKADRAYIYKEQLIAHNLTMETFRVPLIVVALILGFYIFSLMLFVSYFEGWTYTESFYFITISITTIGFGDFVPTKINELVYMGFITLGMIVLVLFISVLLLSVDAIKKRIKEGISFKGVRRLFARMKEWVKSFGKQKKPKERKVAKKITTVYHKDNIFIKAYARSAPDEQYDPTL